jgi:hypothetical protein
MARSFKESIPAGLELTGSANQKYSFPGAISAPTFAQGVDSVSKKKNRKKSQVVGFLGLGLDNKDGHQRLTRAEHFLLVGGSAQTHERMQDTAIRFEEALRRRGKPLEETPVQVVIELMQESFE